MTHLTPGHDWLILDRSNFPYVEKTLNTHVGLLHVELQFYVASLELSSLRLVRRGVQLSAGADHLIQSQKCDIEGSIKIVR